MMSIAYEVQEAGWARVTIYNIRGQKVWQTDSYSDPTRDNVVFWDGRDVRGRIVSNGTYIFILTDERNKVITRGRALILD
jgi:flagellar hook assembly protein FlgD